MAPPQAALSGPEPMGWEGYGFLSHEFDPYHDPFLGDGQMVSLEEAMARTSYHLPLPVTNETTGELPGIWIDNNEQVAFAWETGLHIWVNSQFDDGRWVSEAESAAGWKAKVAEEPGMPNVLMRIDGRPAIGMDKDAGLPPRLTDGRGEEARISESGLTMAIGDASLQFISSVHSLDQLITLAEQLERER
jgi:hypothetical protein